jgi:putative ABC transport system substrate-binding protein
MFDMRRREFIALVGGAAAAWPLAARAQQPMPVIGYLNWLSATGRPDLAEAFRRGLAVAGYVHGRNVVIESRYANNQIDQLRTLAAELIARQVDVIVATGGNNSGLVAKSMTSTIPILFTSGLDPVRAGLVTSLSRPESNVTGVSWFGADMAQKHIELLRELVPSASLVALLLNRMSPESEFYEQTARQAAQAFGLTLLPLSGSTADEIDEAFAALTRRRASGVLVAADAFLTARRTQIVALAARYAVPAIYANREFVATGGLISMGNSVADAYRRVAILAGRILKGAKPSELPIDRATKFELVINLKTASTLGLDVPLSLQMRIDEVIE